MTPEELEQNECRTLLDILSYRAAKSPDRTAYIFLGSRGDEVERLSYLELHRSALRLARNLLSEGLQAGDRALILTGPGLSFLVAFFGAQYAHLVPVTCVTPRKDRPFGKLMAITRSCAPKIAITDADLLSQLSAQLGAEPVTAGLRLVTTESAKEAAPSTVLRSRARGPASTLDFSFARPAPDAISFLQYTSGSTSDPKGVVLTHRNLMANERMIRIGMEHDETSTFVGWTPLHHDQGLIGNVLQPLYVGSLCVLMSPMSFVQRPLLWLQAISKYKAKTSGGPDFAFELCSQRVKPELAATLDLSSWSVAYNGADTVLQSTIERFCQAFAPAGFRREAFFNCYGLAEASLFVAGGPKGLGPTYQGVVRERLGVGELGGTQPGTENAFLVGCGAPAQEELVLVVDPVTRVPVSAGRVGEIWVSGANVARRYWNDETASEALNATLSGPGAPTLDTEKAALAQGARFLRTGDLGFLREDNQLFVTGRIKDLIIVEGRNHYPQDFEATVRRLSPAFVSGGGAALSYRDELGLRVAIVQEVHGTENEKTLTQMIRRAIAEEHEVTVHRVVLVRRGTLPKTSSGKMQRSLVRELLLKEQLVPFRAGEGELGPEGKASQEGASA